VGSFRDLRPALVLDIRDAQDMNRAQLPLPLVSLELRPQQRRAEYAEELLRQRLVDPGRITPEIRVELATALSGRGESALNVLAEPSGHEMERLAVVQVLDGLYFRQGPVAPRFGEQRYIVAAALVTIGATEIDHPRGAVFRKD